MKLVHEILDYSSRDSGLQLLSISAERGERDEVWSTATPVAGRPHFGSEPFLPIWDNNWTPDALGHPKSIKVRKD